MGTPKLLPCPFCGCTNVRSFHVFGSGRYRIDCNACNGGFEANDPERAIALWNRRSDRAGLIAGLREAEAKAREFREHWSCAGGFGGHSAAARIIADTLSARITALEEEGKS